MLNRVRSYDFISIDQSSGPLKKKKKNSQDRSSKTDDTQQTNLSLFSFSYRWSSKLLPLLEFDPLQFLLEVEG
ncbi:hypothetical protein RchiOBHm_Chr2g0132771 [Rosa chinensis]|uniref:Uncharacterized protein n=1 Tax=Rosa chinensis TaxID=74649 RepID=A0A2P6RVE1_ROSCH|nr:hypothetical protein RchiOBHm_Chr2g0132771 [Rosa chinensis]